MTIGWQATAPFNDSSLSGSLPFRKWSTHTEVSTSVIAEPSGKSNSSSRIFHVHISSPNVSAQTEAGFADDSLQRIVCLLFIMGPHPDDLHSLDVMKNLIDQTVLDIDAAGTGASQIAHQFLKG